MEKKLLLLILLLCFGKAFSQRTEGTILNSETSEGIVNAEISTASGIIAVSDADGRFHFTAENFPLKLHISALGFQDQTMLLKNYRPKLQVYLIPSEESLSEVVVRSTLVPNSLRRTPAAVNLVSEEDFKSTGPATVMEVFRFVPGMYVNRGALNTNKISIRGIGARSQYSTNRIQAYFDGIPLTTAEGELNLGDIDKKSLDRIEVIKGPVSSIYGAGLGGAINFYSAEPGAEGTKVEITSDFGSFNMNKNSAKASYSAENASVFANYSHLQTDGYRENGNYDRSSVLLNAKLKASAKDRLSFLANFTRLKAFIPSSLNLEDYNNDPQSAAGNWAAAKGYESYDRGLFGVSYRHQFSQNFSNEGSVFMNFRNGYEPRPFDILKENRTAAGARTKFGLKLELFELSSELSFGAEYFREWYEGSTFENLYEENNGQGSLRGSRLSSNQQDRNYSNFFAQIHLDLTEKWLFEAGFNLNNTNYELTDLFAEDETDQSGSYGFPQVFSPRIGTSYEVANGKNIYASISRGFSVPTVAETLTPEGKINTKLKPETGTNYELGFKGNWLEKRLYTEVAFYSIQVENLLVAERIAEDQYIGVNAGKTDHNGIEFLANLNLELGHGFTARPYANAALNFFKFDEFVDNGIDNSGNKLPGVPESTLDLGFDLSTDLGVFFYSNFRSVGKMPLNDESSDFTNYYQLLNLKAAYRLMLFDALQLNFSAGVNNLLNEHYAASIVPNAIGFGGAPPRYYYPGDPRSYYAGFGASYNF